MIPSEIEIKILAKRAIYGTLGSKGLNYLEIPCPLNLYLYENPIFFPLGVIKVF